MAVQLQSQCGSVDTATGLPCSRPLAPGSATCGYHYSGAAPRPQQHAPSAEIMRVAAERPTLDLDDEAFSTDRRMWNEFYWNSSQTAAAWFAAFPDYEEGIRWNIEGFTPAEALAWRRRGFGPESGEWADVVGADNPDCALDWLRIKGMTPSVASRLRDDGISPDCAAAHYARPSAPAPEGNVQLWEELFFDDPSASREWVEFSPTYAWGVRWYRNGWSVDEARRWSERGFNADAVEWRSLTPSEDPDAAWHWSSIPGMTPSGASAMSELGVTPEEVARERGILLDIV